MTPKNEFEHDISASVPFCKRAPRALYALTNSNRSAPPSVSRARNRGAESVWFRNVADDQGPGVGVACHVLLPRLGVAGDKRVHEALFRCRRPTKWELQVPL